MLKRNKFVYNPETCQYDPVYWTAAELGRAFAQRLAIGIGIAALFLVFSRDHWTRIEAYFLYDEQQAILQKLDQQKVKLAQIETRLNKIYENDRSFYKSILNAKPTDPAVWEAGTGGAVSPQNFVHPVLKDLADKSGKLAHKLTLQKESFVEIAKMAEKKSVELKHIPAIRPVGGRIVSHFGYRADPFHGHSQFHAGLDMTARIGTPIKVSGDGRVIATGPNRGYGIHVEVDHGFGYRTIYAHLSKVKVKVGQKVKRGEVIALSGNTGYSTGPHLHYEIQKNGQKVNPIDYFYTD